MAKIIAHRGFSSRKLENTEASVFLAMEKEYVDMVEVDVRLTKDKKLVLVHDKYIKKIDGKKDYIRKTDYNELIKNPIARKRNRFGHFLYYLKNPNKFLTNYKKYGYIPLLRDVLKETDKKLVLDLKGIIDDDYLEELVKVIKKYRKKLLIKSFDIKAMKRLMAMDLKVEIGLIVDKRIKLEDVIAFDFLSFSKKQINYEVMNKFLEQNKKIMIWTINSYGDFLLLRKKLEFNFNKVYIISDYPDVMNFLNNSKMLKTR